MIHKSTKEKHAITNVTDCPRLTTKPELSSLFLCSFVPGGIVLPSEKELPENTPKLGNLALRLRRNYLSPLGK